MRSRPLAALLGLVAGFTALALGELVAGLMGATSPVVSVGDAVIDRVPSALKDLAIDLFGTNDKIALIVGILILLAGLAAVVGVIGARRRLLGAAGICLVGVIGAVSALVDSSDEGLFDALAPSIVGALAGASLFLFAVPRLPLTRAAEADRSPQVATALDRRRFLGAAAVTALVATGLGAAGRFLQSAAGAAASRAAVVLPRAARRQRPLPDGVELGVDGVVPYTTPNRDFYRIDTAIVVPQVQTEGWTLRIHGMVDEERTYTFDDLLARDLVEADITLACVSNQVGGDLVGNARWLGVRLKELLDEAGVQDGATQIIPRSVDGYEAGFPTEVAMDGREALVAIGMNGEPLPLEHGFPARLVVPGLYGYVSATKWLEEIELTRLEDFDSYWVGRGWGKLAPIKTASRIDTPRGFARLQTGRVPIAGVAWAQGRSIERVEVQVDDEPWAEARLGAGVGDDTWRQWVYEWEATSGPHQLRVRATDGRGDTQVEERVPPIPEGATGWHSVQVTVE